MHRLVSCWKDSSLEAKCEALERDLMSGDINVFFRHANELRNIGSKSANKTVRIMSSSGCPATDIIAEKQTVRTHFARVLVLQPCLQRS